MSESAEGTPWHLPIVLAITTGMRRMELFGLRWASTDLDACLVRVAASLQRVDGALVFLDPKTDRSRRTIALPASTRAMLRRHRVDQNARRLVAGAGWGRPRPGARARRVGRPIDPGHFSHAFSRIAEAAGNPRCGAADLRHAYATQLLVASIPSQGRL